MVQRKFLLAISVSVVETENKRFIGSKSVFALILASFQNDGALKGIFIQIQQTLLKKLNEMLDLVRHGLGKVNEQLGKEPIAFEM